MSVMGVVLGNIWKTNEISKRWREHGALRCVGMHAPAPAHLKKAMHHGKRTLGCPALACCTRPTRSCCEWGVTGAVTRWPVALWKEGAQGPSEGPSKNATGCANG